MTQNGLYERGLAELKAGRFEEARRHFDESEQQAGSAGETKALLKEAEANLARGDLNAAASLLSRVLDRNPGLPETYLGLARIALMTGQLSEARTHATAAVKVAPKVALGWTLLGLVHEAEGDTKGALSHLEKGAALGERSHLSQYNYGRALAATDHLQSAVGFLLRASEIEPGNADTLIALGVVLQKLRQHDDAIEALRRATEAAPGNPDGWATLGDVLFGQKSYADAREVLDRGLAAVGDHPALLEKASACALAQDDVAGAVGYVERELVVAPTHEQGWLNLATLSLLTGKLDRSEEAARTLLARNPQRWEAWLLLGDLYDAKREEAKAEEAYRQALAAAPHEWKVLMNFGAALVQTSDPAKHREGRSLLLRAKEAAPGEARVLYNLALAHVRLGERDEALSLAATVQAQASGAPIAAEAKKLEANLRAQH